MNNRAMKGVMRMSSSSDRERDGLLKQNASMAVEIVKLRETVAHLKQKNRALTVSSLKLPGAFKEVGVQTDAESQDIAKENPVDKVLAKYPTSDKVEYNPLLRERYQYSSALKFSTDDLLDYEELVSTPASSKFSPKHQGKSPKLALSPRMLSSPVMKKKIFHGISDRIVRALYPTVGRSPLKNGDASSAPFSPQPKKKHIAHPESSDEASSSTAILDRTPRRVRKPTSYKEPSLKVKVRRSFKFIQFENPPAEKHKQDLDNVPEETEVKESV